jgi:DNA-binding MarR family transcriptional regulator
MRSDMSDFLPYLLFQAAELTSRDFQKRYQSQYGMLRTEWRVLFHLGQAGEQTAKQVCERASLHKTEVSRAVRALEKKRFVERETDYNDRRRELLSLTKSGRAALVDLSMEAEAFDKVFEDLLGADRWAELLGMLKLLIETRDQSPF